MPQWRKLHTKATESLDINDMPDDFTRLLWVMLPLGLDKEGRGLDNMAWVKAKIMPLRMDVTHKMIGAAMDWYASRGMIRRYSVAGRDYFDIPTFHKYQNTEREAESNFPPCGDLLQTYSRPTPDLLATGSCLDKIRVDKIAPDGASKPVEPSPGSPNERPEVVARKESTRQALISGMTQDEEIMEAIQQHFHITPNWQRKDWGGLRIFLKQRPPEQTIERFSEWWKAHDWRGKQGQPPTAEIIRELWPQAFLSSETGKTGEVIWETH